MSHDMALWDLVLFAQAPDQFLKAFLLFAGVWLVSVLTDLDADGIAVLDTVLTVAVAAVPAVVLLAIRVVSVGAAVVDEEIGRGVDFLAVEVDAAVYGGLPVGVAVARVMYYQVLDTRLSLASAR